MIFSVKKTTIIFKLPQDQFSRFDTLSCASSEDTMPADKIMSQSGLHLRSHSSSRRKLLFVPAQPPKLEKSINDYFESQLPELLAESRIRIESPFLVIGRARASNDVF